MDVSEVSATRQGKIPLGGTVIVSLLTVLVLLLALIAYNSHRLVIEQQRSTCFERLAWLTPGEEELPGGVERSRSARFCEGNSPLIEFQDDA